MLSYQSPMPAGAGTPRYENWMHWLMEGSGVVCATHPAPSWGQAPALHFSCDPGLSLFGRRWLVSPSGARIHPGSESGTCFRTNRRQVPLRPAVPAVWLALMLALGVLFGCVAVQPPAGRTASPTATSAAATNPPATITPSPTTLALPTLTATPRPALATATAVPTRTFTVLHDEDPHGYCHHNIGRGPSRPPATKTGTATATATRTRTVTPTTTATGTAMPSAIRSATPTTTPSATRVATPTPTERPSPTHASSATLTPPASPTSIPVRTSWRVPILMYHYIRVNPDPSDRLGFSLSIPPAEFDRQMRYLAEDGYGTVSFDQIYDSSQPLPEKPILLTFDDGYADAYTAAFPVLQRYGFRATFYVVTDFVGRPGYLTVEQIREMAAAGMSFGSHSVSHLSLTTLSAERLERELSQSRTQLEGLLERPVLDLCYPLGRFNQGVRQAVERAGYRSATTTQYGFASSGGDQLLLPRIRIWGGLILRNFASLIAGE